MLFNNSKKEISSKTWCIFFFCVCIIVLLCICLLNYITDPFGVFGDKFLSWFSYDFTNNPRVAKITYLDKHHDEYDSYIIGCSSTSSYPTEALNKYFDAKFYNMIMYGADMLDVEEECRYILDNYGAKNIIVNIYLLNGSIYNEESDKITRNLHANVNGESKLLFYTRYLFLNPQYAVAKIKAKKEDTYLTKPFDVFNSLDGTYDKKVRDAEPIGDLDSYLEAYPAFSNYPYDRYDMTEIDNNIQSIKRIKEMCDEKGVNLVFTTSPMYYENINYFSKEDIQKFFKEIAKVTPFWDFSFSSISFEPRYFYDETHFRNSVGKMAIARMFNDENEYFPEDFGYWVTKENVDDYLKTYFEKSNDVSIYTKSILVLMYHHISEDVKNGETISPKKFEEHIKALCEEGYTAISLQELYNYVYKGIDLPEKVVLITFDDGYLSNYEYAFPVLKKYNMKATIFAVGSSIGHTKYKDTQYDIIPHFTYDEAIEMEETGLISVESHTYDMHQWRPYENSENVRENVLSLPNESEEQTISALREDFNTFNDEMKENMNKSITALAFPHGEYETLSNVILREQGVKATFGTKEEKSIIIKGLPQSLLGLNRFNMCEDVSVGELLEKLK